MIIFSSKKKRSEAYDKKTEIYSQSERRNIEHLFQFLRINLLVESDYLERVPSSRLSICLDLKLVVENLHHH